MSIFVGNLSYEVSEQDLVVVFAEYGSVQEVKLITDRDTGRMRGFGFVRLEDPNSRRGGNCCPRWS